MNRSLPQLNVDDIMERLEAWPPGRKTATSRETTCGAVRTVRLPSCSAAERAASEWRGISRRRCVGKDKEKGGSAAHNRFDTGVYGRCSVVEVVLPRRLVEKMMRI